MEIRKIKPEEYVASSLVQEIAYLANAPKDYRQRLKNPLPYSDGYEYVWAGFDRAGKICSVAGVFDYQTRFDGHTVAMGGAGGVATLPEARKGGYVRGIMEAVLPVMREEGKVFSFLYPFSFGFYRKFGYELCYTPNRVTVPVRAFQEYPFPGGVEQYFPGGDISELMAVYNTFIRDKNLPLVRDAAAMRKRADRDPYTEKHYAYLHRDGSRGADAYLLFNVKDEDGGGCTLNVRELAWTSPDGMRAMFGFIGVLSPEFENLRWDAPRFVNLPALFADAFDIDVSPVPYGMNRVLNVRRALELLKAPEPPGRAAIRVTDTALPSNDGVYDVEWGNGRSSVFPSAREPDLDTDIQTLTQLITGFLTPGEAALKRGAAINGNEGALRALFPHKDLYIADHF